MTNSPIQNEQTPTYVRLGPRGTMVAGLVLAGCGAVLAFIGYSSHAIESEDWPSVEGVITASEVESRGPRDDRMYYPTVSYEYSVEGRTFTSSRISFRVEGIESTNRVEIAEFLEQYGPGAKVAVYYKPDDPSVSCLEPGTGLGAAFLLGAALVAIGLLIVVSGVVAAIRKVVQGA